MLTCVDPVWHGREAGRAKAQLMPSRARSFTPCLDMLTCQVTSFGCNHMTTAFSLVLPRSGRQNGYVAKPTICIFSCSYEDVQCCWSQYVCPITVLKAKNPIPARDGLARLAHTHMNLVYMCMWCGVHRTIYSKSWTRKLTPPVFLSPGQNRVFPHAHPEPTSGKSRYPLLCM